MNKAIKIDNRDTENIHIDTYQMLTGDTADEYTIESEREKQKDNTLEYDSFEWTYDHKQIVRDFAEHSIMLIHDAIKGTQADKIINSIELHDTGSPKFYNYTTDHYCMRVEVDEKALEDYTHEYNREIVAIAEKYHQSIIDGIISKESMQHASICHLLNTTIEKDDYNMAMWEAESEIYMNNTTYKLIK